MVNQEFQNFLELNRIDLSFRQLNSLGEAIHSRHDFDIACEFLKQIRYNVEVWHLLRTNLGTFLFSHQASKTKKTQISMTNLFPMKVSPVM